MMKNSIKFLFVATLIAAFGFSAKAQPTNTSTTVNASATVLTALSFGTITPVLFGNISATTTGVVYLDPKNAASNYVGVSAANGVVPITGAISTSIRLTWPVNIDLVSGSNHLNYVLAVNGYESNDKVSSGLLTLTGAYKDVTTAADGKYFLFIGGSLGGTGTSPVALSTQAAGTYSGDATFTVEYN